MDPETLQQRLLRFKETLKGAGVKMTHQRLEIFREVAKSGEHPDAETVYKGVRRRVPSVSLDTVYRNLWLLLDLGLVNTVGSSRDRVRFDANVGAHHHFVCRECGLTRDFYSGEFDRLRVPGSAKEFGDVEKMQVECMGVCSKCARKSKTIRQRRTSKGETT